MAVDKNNHIWVLQRPSSNVKDDLGLDEKVSMCCTSAPPVLEFDGQATWSNRGGRPR